MELFSLLFGGITGLIGKSVNTYFSYKMKKLELAHKEVMIEKETTATLKEAEAMSKLKEIQYKGITDTKELEAFTESIKSGRNISEWSYKAVEKLFEIEGYLAALAVPLGIILLSLLILAEFIRIIIRPSLTVVYTFACGYILYNGYKIMTTYNHFLKDLSPTVFYQYFSSVINAIIYITVTITLWWFGERADKHVLEKFKKK